MARPSYRHAVAWLLDNDDTDFLDEEAGHLSVAGALVADLFGKPDEEVRAALLRLRTGRARVGR